MKGRVFKSTGSWYLVKAESGEMVECRLRGKFRQDGLRTSNPIAVGDWIEFEIEEKGEGKAVITEIVDRENYVIRKSPHNKHSAHMIAANVGQALLIVTLKMPRTSMGFIDRFLVSCEAYGIPAMLIFNKADLLDKEELEMQKEISEMYEAVGYACHLISALEGRGIKHFRNLLDGETSLLSGHSGAGKSTLINQLSKDIQQKTSEISEFASKGVHTTTFAEMFELDERTYIIDTPGIKELGLVDIEAEELAHFFPEMRALLGQCKFHNCTHEHEPGCKVIEKLVAGEIHESRYQSYLSMLSGEDNRK